MGADEYHPISHNGSNVAAAGGIGYTVIGALDTILLMGLNAEFRRARDWIEHELTFDRDAEFNTFKVRRFNFFTRHVVFIVCRADYDPLAWRPSFCVPPHRRRRSLPQTCARSRGPHSSRIRYPLRAPTLDGEPPAAQRGFIQG